MRMEDLPVLYNRSGAPCGESGVAVAVWQQRQVAAAGRSRPGGINQGVARAFARVRRPGVLGHSADRFEPQLALSLVPVSMRHGFLWTRRMMRGRETLSKPHLGLRGVNSKNVRHLVPDARSLRPR